MSDLQARIADKIRTAMVEAWDDSTEYADLPGVAASHLMPVIVADEIETLRLAAHRIQADAIGWALDRIDALHACEVVAVHEAGPESWCPTCEVTFPCPTRRLTQAIREEIRHG